MTENSFNNICKINLLQNLLFSQIATCESEPKNPEN